MKRTIVLVIVLIIVLLMADKASADYRPTDWEPPCLASNPEYCGRVAAVPDRVIPYYPNLWRVHVWRYADKIKEIARMRVPLNCEVK